VSEELIPIVMFISIAAVVGLFFWFKYRSRSDMQTTIRAAIERGQELSPEIVDRLGQPVAPRDRDLRLALIWLALAAGLALCGLSVPDPSGYSLQGCLAGAAFPFCLGVAYLILWRFADHDK
jgi:hypothetical protein